MTEASDTPKKPRKKTERLRLNKSNVESLSVPGEYHDDQLLGFLVRVSNDKGVVRRTYRVRAKPKGKLQAFTYTIGRHGEYTVEQARDKARSLINQIRDNHNPYKEKKAEEKLEKEAKEQERIRKDFTLRVAFDDCLKYKAPTGDRKQKGRWSPTTAAQYTHHIYKTLGDWLDKPMVEIDEDMVLAKYRQVCDSSISNAKNAFTDLSTIFNWYIKKDRGKTLASNPVKILSDLNQWVEVKPRGEVIEDANLETWWHEVEELENPDHVDYLKMLLLTGLRKNELATMLWENVRFEHKYWIVEDTKNRRDHSLPFTNCVGSILKRRRDNAGQRDVYVFPGRMPGSHLTSAARSQKLIEQAGVSSCPKVLRATFCTMAGRAVQADYIVKRFMNHHNSRDVTQHHYVNLKELEGLREHLQSVEDLILHFCTDGIEKEKVEAASG